MLWKLIAWLPGGQIIAAIGAFLEAALKFMGWLLTKFTEGLTKMLANPVTFITAGVLMLAAYGFGIGTGIKWDAQLVKKATGRMETAQKERDEARTENDQWKGRLDDQTKLAAEAAKAREIAEAKAGAALARLQRAGGVRDIAGAAAKAGSPKAP